MARPPVSHSSLLAAIAAACWVVSVTPDISDFVRDADGGLFIQGAYDWRHAGMVPQVDVFSSYGPLSYAPRVVAQAMLGERLIAEVALVAIAYGLAFGLFFSVCRELSGSPTASWALLAVALLCLPRYYKWPVVLIPALTGWMSLRLLRGRMTRATAAASGGAVGLAWLFRHDYLVYSACVAALAWWMRGWREPEIRRLLPHAALGFVVVAGPWLAVLALKRGLVSYVFEIAGVTGSHAVGLGLPHPLLDWSSTGATVLFAAAYGLPVLTAVHGVTSPDRSKCDRQLAWLVLTLAVVFLPQSMHRADPGHLLQVLPGCLMGVAVVLGRRVLAITAWFLLAAVGGAAWSLGAITRPGLGPESLPTTLGAALAPASDALTDPAAAAPAVPSQALAFLRACAPRGTPVAVYPFAPQLAWLSGHVHGGPFLVLVPGYFDDDASERWAADRLQRDGVSVVLWDEAFAFDGRAERRPVETHSILHAAVSRAFLGAGLVDGFSIFVAPPYARAVTRCLDVQRTAAVIPRYASTLAEGIKFWQHGLPTFLIDMTGLAPHEPWGRWTDGAAAVFRFSAPLPRRFTLVVTGAAYGPNLNAPVEFVVGDRTQIAVFSTELGKGTPDVRRMPFDLEADAATLEIRPPSPRSPGGGDRRRLGLALIQIQIEPEGAGVGVVPRSD